jgi:hypothetical protein
MRSSNAKFTILFLTCRLIYCISAPAFDDLWRNWLHIENTYLPKAATRSLRIPEQMVIIGGIPFSGIERISSYVQASGHLQYLDLAEHYWNVTSRLSSRQAEDSPLSELISHIFSGNSTQRQVIIDSTGFEFLLELSSVFVSAKSIEYFLIVTEPEISWLSLKRARSLRCDAQHRLSSAKLNAKWAEIDQSFVSSFGVTCPSNTHALKMFHYKNLLAKLIATLSKGRIKLHVIDINR